MIQLIFLALIVVFSAIGAYFARKVYMIMCDSWVFYDNLLKETEDMNKSITNEIKELHAFMKLTFDNNFAKKVEDIVKGRIVSVPTTKIIADNGQEYEVPIDHGF